MKKLITAVSLVCFSMCIRAQIQIQTTLPTVGLVQKNQLWNLVLVNSSGNTILGRIEMVLLDRQTSQELMTAVTAEFQLPAGPVLVNVNKLSPIQYIYIGIEPDRRINSLLPVGTYSVCYSFVQGAEKKVSLVEECVSFDIEALSPPMLVFPVDSSVLETPPAQFTWTPPTPAALMNQLHYEVLITEVQPTQKPAEAITENFPFFSTDKAFSNFLTYPAALPAFEKDKWYAWQVIARDKNNYAAKTEVWVFKITAPASIPQALQALPYIQLQKSGAEKTIAPNGYLRFNYFNQLADSVTMVSIADLSERTKEPVVSFNLPVKRGQNFIQKDISRLVKMQEGHLYMLTLQNSAMEKWYIQFEVKKY